jgi:hypothetical protein
MRAVVHKLWHNDNVRLNLMRGYKTLPRLWCVMSIATFLAIGFAVRLPYNKEKDVSLAGSFIDYFFSGILTGREGLSVGFLIWLAVWVGVSIVVGWLLHGLIVIFLRRHEKPSV